MDRKTNWIQTQKHNSRVLYKYLRQKKETQYNCKDWRKKIGGTFWKAL